VKYLRQTWSESKIYRIILVIIVIYTVLRLLMQGVFLMGMLFPEEPADQTYPDDLRIYLDAAERVESRQDLYPQGKLDRMEFYQYPPAFALAFTPFLRMSPSAASVLHTLLHIIAYILLYVWWRRIFERLGMERACEMLAWTLPVWLVFTAFWSDLGFLNVYIIMALLSTWFIEAVLDENLGRSLLWLSIILQIKPQWAFAAAVPLLLGRYRFFAKLVGSAIAVYAAVAVVTILVIGPAYGGQQYTDYAQLLWSIRGGDYPWRGPDAPYLGYNHSITQTIVYMFGATPTVLTLATGVKLLILLPLIITGLRYLRHPVRQAGHAVPRLGLDLAFVLYAGAFIWLDVVWEFSLGIAVFTYLLATFRRRGVRLLIWFIFLLYALIDLGTVMSFVIFGPDIIDPGPYVLTDISIYIPVTMIAILTFYILLIKRLWTTPLPIHEGG
jgi:hypothetical protein